MKTLLLAPELFASEGGISRILRLYLKALCDLAEPSGEVRAVVLNDVVIDSRELRTYATDRLTSWAACRRNRTSFVRAALSEARGVDLIICGHIGQLPVAWLARKRYRTPKYVLVAHGLEVWRRFGLVERAALRGAAQVWCVSEYTRSELTRNCPLRADQTVVLPNGLDPAFDEVLPKAAPSNAPVLLTVSRLSQADCYKGIDHLITAMPAVRQAVPGAMLRIVGRGDDLPRLQELAASLGLAGVVHFLGYISDQTMSDEFTRCRAFALPSEREGFGLVYLEAMAHGKPCIGALAGGTPEVITPASGLLTPYGDVQKLAAACIRALNAPWDTQAIQARSRHFSYVNFRERLSQLLVPYTPCR